MKTIVAYSAGDLPYDFEGKLEASDGAFIGYYIKGRLRHREFEPAIVWTGAREEAWCLEGIQYDDRYGKGWQMKDYWLKLYEKYKNTGSEEEMLCLSHILGAK